MMGKNTRRYQTLVISDQTVIHDVTVTDTHLVDGKLNGYCRLDSFPQVEWLVRQVNPVARLSVWMIIGWVRHSFASIGNGVSTLDTSEILRLTAD